MKQEALFRQCRKNKTLNSAVHQSAGLAYCDAVFTSPKLFFCDCYLFGQAHWACITSNAICHF